MIRVLFICVHNGARSQIAEAYLRTFGSEEFFCESAGLEPGELNPYVVRALQEENIDITEKKTQGVMDLLLAGNKYDYVITVCSKEAQEKCPRFPGIHESLLWPFPDPATFTGTDEKIMTQVREVRDAIKEKVWHFHEGVRPVRQ